MWAWLIPHRLLIMASCRDQSRGHAGGSTGLGRCESRVPGNFVRLLIRLRDPQLVSHRFPS